MSPDDICLLNVKQSIKEIKKIVNKDLKSLLHWLNTNKISLNVTKTGVVIFRVNPSHHVKYLVVYLNEYLIWTTHVNQLCVKLVKANPMLPKIHYFVNETTLQYIYFDIFNSHLSYACTAWGQSIVPSHTVCILQRNTLRIICFAKLNDYATQF